MEQPKKYWCDTCPREVKKNEEYCATCKPKWEGTRTDVTPKKKKK